MLLGLVGVGYWEVGNVDGSADFMRVCCDVDRIVMLSSAVIAWSVGHYCYVNTDLPYLKLIIIFQPWLTWRC